METMEAVAQYIAADDKMECPFPHEPKKKSLKNEIPSDFKNCSKTLGTNLDQGNPSERDETGGRIASINLKKPITFKNKVKAEVFGFSPHHLIPGNEIWNNKNHPLHAWIHEKANGSKVNGDIGYKNNAKYNGVDLPSHYKVSGWRAFEAADPDGQFHYAVSAMDSDGQGRQFHDAHKAYSDLVWNSLTKIAEKVEAFAESNDKKKRCDDEDCCTNNKKGGKFDPPLNVLPQLTDGVTIRLRSHLMSNRSNWKLPLFTSRFACMYCLDITDQNKARWELEEAREKMGRPTDKQ